MSQENSVKSPEGRKALEIVERLAKQSREKATKKGLEGGQLKKECNVVKLPVCKDSERTIPNIIARSALFGVIKRGVRPYKDKQLIASREDIKIYYTGKTLDQADCTVWMQALAFVTALGQDTPVNRSGFLKLLGKTNGKKDYLWLNNSLERLMTGIVSIEAKLYKLEFHLIDLWGEFKEGGISEYLLNINPKVIRMWANSEYTKVEWGKRLAIRRGSDLACWMQLYIRSNTNDNKPHHISLFKLKNWCGLSRMRADHFRVAMKKSLAELLRVGEIIDVGIRDDDMVIFTRVLAHRDSNTSFHRDSNTSFHRDSNTSFHRDSNTSFHRDSNTKDRDSNTKDRDSNTKDRDSNTPVKNNHLKIKDFFKRFFL